MPEVIPNLWPKDIGRHATLTPLAILRQQAANLGEQTQNLVKAVVESQQVADTVFEHTLVLVAPLLGFRFPLFHVRHGIQLYPIQLWESDGDLRDDGEAIVKVVNTIQNSSLNKVLSQIGVLGIQAETIISSEHSINFLSCVS